MIWSPGVNPSSSIHTELGCWTAPSTWGSEKSTAPQGHGTNRTASDSWDVCRDGRNSVPLGILGLCRMTLLFVHFCQFVQDSEHGRRRIIYPLTYRLCLVYKQQLYKLLRKLFVKNNNNSPRSPPVVSTFSPLENPLGPKTCQGRAGKGWERWWGRRSLEHALVPPVLLSSSHSWVLCIYIYYICIYFFDMCFSLDI